MWGLLGGDKVSRGAEGGGGSIAAGGLVWLEDTPNEKAWKECSEPVRNQPVEFCSLSGLKLRSCLFLCRFLYQEMG